MMKNFFLSALLIFIFGNLCHVGLPWWAIAPLAAIFVWLLPPKSMLGAFAAGFLAGMSLWWVNAYLLNLANDGIFAAKIGEIFQGRNSSTLLYATALMGGLLGGFGALTGYWAKDLTKKQDRQDYYSRRRRSGKYR